MAGSSLLALIDDIASLLDDISVLSKVAAKKTAGVLGDDLALNAQQVSGMTADRELPVVWAVAKGSMVNKAILVPAAIAIGYFAPWAVTPLLMAGGVFLCYEGVEKLVHSLMHRRGARDGEPHDEARPEAGKLAAAQADPAGYEKGRIKGAVRTDFILSAEIITITLGIVADAPLTTQIAVMVAVAVAMTVGVYGIVAGIVKLDDLGLWLSRRGGGQAALGRGILAAAPWLMKALSVLGTLAMFLVGGGIITHGIGALQHWVHERASAMGGFVEALLPLLASLVVGLAAGAAALLVVGMISRLRGGKAAGA